MFHRSKHSFIRDRGIGFVIHIIISEQQTPEAEMKFLDINLKVPKREIFDSSDFPDFYTMKSLRVCDFGVKI
jgi:hypothetical protein